MAMVRHDDILVDLDIFGPVFLKFSDFDVEDHAYLRLLDVWRHLRLRRLAARAESDRSLDKRIPLDMGKDRRIGTLLDSEHVDARASIVMILHPARVAVLDVRQRAGIIGSSHRHLELGVSKNL